MNLYLQPFTGETEAALSLIRGFWKAHNGDDQTREEAMEDLRTWTMPGHKFYFIQRDTENVGFLHLGSRGGEPDWLEEIYVAESCQNQGIGTRAIQLAEDIVKEYSESMYMEAAARNEGAIRLYRRLGYDCLNTVTVRKDFRPEDHTVIRRETIYGQEFNIKQYREP